MLEYLIKAKSWISLVLGSQELPMPDPMQVLIVEVPDGPEKAEAIRLFRLTAPASVRMESVCYVQNLALWYSFAVKRQTKLMREKGALQEASVPWVSIAPCVQDCASRI